MLKLRISPGLGALLMDPSPKSQLELAQDAQQRLEKSPVWLYEQKEGHIVEDPNARDHPLKTLSNSELTLILERAADSADWDFDVIKVRRTTRDDRFAMLMGQQIHQLAVLPATHETEKTVNRVFVIVLDHDKYEQLAPHDRFLVSAAWKRAHQGRQYAATKLGAFTLYLMTAIATQASTSTDESELDTILRDYGIGRVTADPFEIRLLQLMLDEDRRSPCP